MKKQIPTVFLIWLFFSCFWCVTTLLSNTAGGSDNDKRTLGRYLFYDTRMSYNLTKSCSSCHDPLFAFSDGYRTSSGADGYNVKRNSPSLINSRYALALTWADSSVKNYRQQMLFPIFNEHPNELGWKGHEEEIIQRFKNEEWYRPLFKKAFPSEQEPVTNENIISAISFFEEQLVSFGSPYDLFLRGDKKALSAKAVQGMSLFFSEELACSKCHDLSTKKMRLAYYNTGLYNRSDDGAYPEEDQGLYDYTKVKTDKGKFRAPSLKNVMLTAPYTHDGSVGSIEEMLAIYQRGGRQIIAGKSAGDGSLNVNKSPLIGGFTITAEEKAALIAFFSSLTDTAFLLNKNLLNPFNQ